MGFGEVGLEPDHLAAGGDRLVQLPLGQQGLAETEVGPGVIGFEPDQLAVFGDGPAEDRRSVGVAAALLQVTPQAAQVTRVVGPSICQVAEDRLGLGVAAHAFEQVGQLVGRFGPEGAGRSVVPRGILPGRGRRLGR